MGSGNVWTRKFIWDAKADVGAVKIDDVVLTVILKPIGCVQLWENGPYWAECNAGASRPEECGYYFWWGDTVGYKRNSANNGWVSVKDGSSFSFSSGNCPTYDKDISPLQSMGYIDSTGNLVAKCDAATVHFGVPWRMPTHAEFSALINNCTTIWTTRNGVSGRLFTGKGAYSSKSIFFPAAGEGRGSDIYDYDIYGLGIGHGYYWSSMPASGNVYGARGLEFYFDDFHLGYYNSRFMGRPVRPVRGFAETERLLTGTGATTHFALVPPVVEVSGVEAQQRYPWNGLVDITVTIQGVAEDVASVECVFLVTNGVVKAAIPAEHITRNGDDMGSGNVWMRKFIWDAKDDVGEVKIDDVALTVVLKPMGVQLWENGPYWAEYNVGATKPEETGYYFWWGDTVGYKRNASNTGWISVKDSIVFAFNNGNYLTYGKSISQLQLEGYIDTTGNLVAAHDAATVHLGAPWRIPTDAEFDALIYNCTTTWTTRNGVPGRLVTGKGAYSSKSIFFPAGGSGYWSYLDYFGSYAFYWSATPHSGDVYKAWSLNFSDVLISLVSHNNRNNGLSVRPIRGFADASANISDNATTTHLPLDTRAGSRDLSTEGANIRYDASWYESGISANVKDNGTVIASGVSGDFTWLPADDGAHTLKLSVFDGAGTLVGLETAEFVVGRKSITYVNLHGATHTNPEMYQEGTAVAFTPPSGRMGYAFTGWTPAAITTDMTGAQTVTAEWRANSYQIVYDANGGSGTMADEPMTYDAEKALTTCAFMRKGYTFAGWATSADGEVKYANGATVKNLTATAGGTVTLYAKWTPNTYVIDFNPGHGCTGSMSDQLMTYDEEEALYLNLFRRTGYTFLGWTDDPNEVEEVLYYDGVVVSNLTDTVDGEFDLYAVWMANEYVVKFDANSGRGTMAEMDFLYDEAQPLTANAFTKTGYTFAGWAVGAPGGRALPDCASVENLTAEAGGVVTLYAKWTANAYTVRFNANGGSGTMANETMTYDAAKALAANGFTRTGYVFAGWATSANGAVKYANGATVSNLVSSGVMALYAKWVAIGANAYAISFNANGGTGVMTPLMCAAGRVYKLPKCGFAKPEGKTRFAGWAGSNGRRYDDEMLIFDLAQPGGAVKMTAIWE